MLGGLEQKIMEVLWSSSTPLKPSEVLAKIDKGHAYTTIMTVLKRMTDKKLVKRKLQGNAFFYTFVEDKTTFACSALEDLFERLFFAYGEHTTVSFKKIAKNHGIKL